jgi:hypothetical protein
MARRTMAAASSALMPWKWMCTSAARSIAGGRVGHLTVTCRAPEYRSVWYRPQHEP